MLGDVETMRAGGGETCRVFAYVVFAYVVSAFSRVSE
jgi:hypothetical protein